jgi:hypothetical protein
MFQKIQPLKVSEFPMWLKLVVAGGLLGGVVCDLLRVNVQYSLAIAGCAALVGYSIQYTRKS